MDTVSHTLSNLIRSNRAFQKAYHLYIINKNWDSLVGTDISSRSFVVRIAQRNLVIATSSPAWSQQISMMKASILQGVRELTGIQNLTNIRLQASSLIEVTGLKKEIIGLAKPDRETRENIEEMSLELEKKGILGDNIPGDLSSKLQKIYALDAILKKKRTQKGWKECSICKGLCNDRDGVCPVCSSKMEQDLERTVITYLRDVPWARYSDIRVQHPGISEQFFRKVKKQYAEQLRDDILKKSAAYRAVKDEALRRHIIAEAERYVMIESGQEPHKVTAALMRRKLWKTVYETLYNTTQLPE